MGLATGKQKSRSMLEKSGSTTGVSGLLSEAHMELCSVGEAAIRLMPARGLRGSGWAEKIPHLLAPCARVWITHTHESSLAVTLAVTSGPQHSQPPG